MVRSVALSIQPTSLLAHAITNPGGGSTIASGVVQTSIIFVYLVRFVTCTHLYQQIQWAYSYAKTSPAAD